MLFPEWERQIKKQMLYLRETEVLGQGKEELLKDLNNPE